MSCMVCIYKFHAAKQVDAVQVHSWVLEGDGGAGAADIAYVLKPRAESGDAAWRSDVPLLCANTSGHVYALTPG